MKKAILLILIFTVSIIQSCDEYVDIEPKGSAIASSLDDVDQLLGNTSELSFELGVNITSIVNDNIQMTDEAITVVGTSRDASFLKNIYQLAPVFFEGVQSDPEWQRHYLSIGYANHILEVLEEIDTDNPLKNTYAGEAKVHRAYHYFQLVNIYGVHYGLPQAGEPGSGVPLLTVFSDDTIPISRSSVNEIYEFVLQDLNDAVNLLPDRNGRNNRPGKAAALGLLAEVYLHMGNYESALVNAEGALAINSTLLDYNTDLIEDVGTFFIPTDIDNPENLLMKVALIPNAFNQIDQSTIDFSGFSDELIAINDFDNDLRLMFTRENPATGKIQLSEGYIYELGVTVPKLLLIQAESLARTGNPQEAMNVVNALRAKRFEISFVDSGGHMLIASDANEAVAHIIEENRREFHVNGKRFFDIKRLNAIENAGISLTRGTITFSPNSINWAMPISERVINTSMGQIQQNPRE
ncbi:RagB/SusD family nutrient uptake outer membrane protein [uncultured Algibacter sp.]|uniref:RagB/SusD family nutrient uptake outer membrane protein n=1 Tax=uncultured Algibacter sp. TaxID=298659 RepID=UPI003217DD1C